MDILNPRSFTPETPAFPPHLWGTKFLELQSAPDAMRGGVYRVAEGFSIVATCDRCGGRREILVDARTGESEGGHRVASGAAEVHAWAGEHRCDDTTIDPAVERWATQALTKARHEFQAGRFDPSVRLLMADGAEASLPVDTLPRDEFREMSIRMSHYVIREQMRAEGVKSIAALLLAEFANAGEGSWDRFGSVLLVPTLCRATLYDVAYPASDPSSGRLVGEATVTGAHGIYMLEGLMPDRS